ncbi:MAG: hypothetical protein AAB502_09005 [Chloroflexota bacterium]
MPRERVSPAVRRPRWGLPLVLALGLWLCTLPLVGLALALGVLPWQGASPVLGLALAGDLLACFVLCHTVLRGWNRGSDLRAAHQVCVRHASGR